MTQRPMRVAVTGAAGQIGYSLLFPIAAGQIFGPEQRVILQLLELPMALNALEGVKMELLDGAFPLVDDVIVSSDANVAFKDADLVLCVGSKPRGPGMERADLIRENGPFLSDRVRQLMQMLTLMLRWWSLGIPAIPIVSLLSTRQNEPTLETIQP